MILLIFLFTFGWFLLCALKLKYSLHMMQLIGYKNDKYLEWIESHKNKIHTIIGSSESDLIINERTYELLLNVKKHLGDALNSDEINFDIFAEQIRISADFIGKILGVISTTEVANATFNQLCLGK